MHANFTTLLLLVLCCTTTPILAFLEQQDVIFVQQYDLAFDEERVRHFALNITTNSTVTTRVQLLAMKNTSMILQEQVAVEQYHFKVERHDLVLGDGIIARISNLQNTSATSAHIILDITYEASNVGMIIGLAVACIFVALVLATIATFAVFCMVTRRNLRT